MLYEKKKRYIFMKKTLYQFSLRDHFHLHDYFYRIFTIFLTTRRAIKDDKKCEFLPVKEIYPEIIK